MKSSRSRLETTGETVTAACWLMLGDETLSAANGLELLQRLLHLFRRVRGHATGAQDRLADVDGRVDARVGVNALCQQRLPEHHRCVLVAQVDRNDGRLRFSDIESQAEQAFPPSRAQLLKTRDHLRLAFQDS